MPASSVGLHQNPNGFKQSHSATQSQTLSFEAFIKGAWESVVTSEAFCRNGMRDREEQNSAKRVFLFKSFSLKTFIAFVTLFRNTVTNITPGHSGPEEWEGTNSQRQSVSGDSHDFIGMFSY